MTISLVQCQICGKNFKHITPTHLKRHSISIAEYRLKFPDAPVISPELADAIIKRTAACNEQKKGIPRTQEVKDKISKKNKGKIAWNKNVPMSDEQKIKLSEIKTEGYASGKYIHWNKGNNWSEEIKEKIRAGLLSKNLSMSEESKIKRNITLEQMKQNGWIHPSQRPEVKEKIREANIKKYNRHTPHLQHITDENYKKLLSKEWLYEQHIVNRRSLVDMSNEIGVCDGVVGRNLHSLGIETQHNNKGGYTFEYFENYPENKDKNGIFYCVVMYNENERFVKIGITSRSVEERYKYEREFMIDIIIEHKTTLFEAFTIEQDLIIMLNEHRYYPEEYFGGYSECFNINVLEMLI